MKEGAAIAFALRVVNYQLSIINLLFNASILRIDSPGAPDAGGKVVMAIGGAMKCRCLITEPTARDQYSGLGMELQGSMVLRVIAEELAAAVKLGGYAVGTSIAAEQRLAVRDDNGGVRYWRVRNVITQPHGSRSGIVAELRKD